MSSPDETNSSDSPDPHRGNTKWLMAQIFLRYGTEKLRFDYDPGRFTVLAAAEDQPALTDLELGTRLDSPIGKGTIEDLVAPDDSVLLVVPDATRKAGAGQVVNLLVRRLIANGTAPFNISIIFATAIHRLTTEQEKAEIVTPFIAQRIKMFDHDPRNLMGLVKLGETSDGTPIELNRLLAESGHVIIVGGVGFHYFAGFSGGRKLICPGLASARTATGTHKLAFDCGTRDRRKGVGPAMLDGNAVHTAFLEAAARVPVSFAVNTIVNDDGAITDIYCGDPVLAHRAACAAYASKHTITVPEVRENVIVGCGGHPHDINLIQAHKALVAAAEICQPGGEIVLIADCPDGPGRSDFLQWFDAGSSNILADRLCESYKVNGQTAWSLMRITERYKVSILTSLDSETCGRVGMKTLRGIDDLAAAGNSGTGYILPAGAKYLYRSSGDA